jgi:hypothetical protein
MQYQYGFAGVQPSHGLAGPSMSMKDCPDLFVQDTFLHLPGVVKLTEFNKCSGNNKGLSKSPTRLILEIPQRAKRSLLA